MTRDRRIGGDLGLAALDALTGESYAARAQRHRPSDPHAIAAEVRRLHARGLTARDISVALRIALPHVQELLGRLTP